MKSPAASSNDTAEIEIKGRKAWVFKRARKDADAADQQSHASGGGTTAGATTTTAGEASKFYYVKGRLPDGRQWLKCTGFATLKDATKAAKALWAAKLEERLDVLASWSARKEERVATIGEILEAHEKGIARASVKLQDDTGDGYRRAMRRLLAWGMGLHEDPTGRGTGKRKSVDEEEIAKVPSSVLTAELVDKFEGNYLKPWKGNPLRTEAALRSAHTVLRNARSLFSRRAMKVYAGLKLPDLSGFLGAQINKADKVKHRRLDDEAIAEMARAALELKETQPELYYVHLVARHLGLRPIEIAAARVGWLRPRKVPAMVRLPDGTTREVVATLIVEKTEYFDPKGSSGEVPIGVDVWAELQPWIAGRRADEMLVRGTDREREELVYKRHADFVRPWTREHQKRTYELRRWAATRIAKLHGVVEMAERFLRHAPRTVAELHYLTELSLPAPITFADVGLGAKGGAEAGSAAA